MGKFAVQQIMTFEPEGDMLCAHLSPGDFGFIPEQVWNPSPSVRHRTAPYELPMTVTTGIQGNEVTGAKFSPPPFAVELEGRGERALVAVAADAGWHLWNEVVFDCCREEVQVKIDLEGNSPPREVAEHARLLMLPAAAGEPRHALLRRGLLDCCPDARDELEGPEWWRRPIYCGWGDQVSTSVWLEGPGPESRALAYCLQGLYERWLNRLEEAEVPIGTVIIDAGWSPGLESRYYKVAGPAGSHRPAARCRTKSPAVAGDVALGRSAGRMVYLRRGREAYCGSDQSGLSCVRQGTRGAAAFRRRF
jgi:hypothetical protein